MSDPGATVYGLFLLGDDYLRAAEALDRARLHGMTDGPTVLLSLHANELYLKAYLREVGMEHPRLRAYRHDFDALLTACSDAGLAVPAPLKAQLRRASRERTYVETRYQVTRARQDGGASRAVRMTRAMREVVREALPAVASSTVLPSGL